MKHKIIGIVVVTLLIVTVFSISATSDNGEMNNFCYENKTVDGWYKKYGGDGIECLNWVEETSDGGFIAAGKTDSFGAGDWDAWLVHVDSSGDEIWNMTYGGPNKDALSYVEQTSDGGYILVGLTENYGAGNSDVWLIKTDSFSNEQWNKTFGGSGDDRGWTGQITSDGDYIFGGLTSSYASGYEDYWIIKTDEYGNEIWNKTFGHSSYFDECLSVRETNDNGYMILGLQWPGNPIMSAIQGSDVLLIKTDNNGNPEWEKTFSSNRKSKWEHGMKIRQTSDGCYILIGTKGVSRWPMYLGGDVWLIKIDADGNKLWEKTYGASLLKDAGWCVHETLDGGYIVTGLTNGLCSWVHKDGFFPMFCQLYLMKTDGNGNQIWEKTIRGTGMGRYVQLTSDGGYIIAGNTWNYANPIDAVLIKTNSDGDYN